MLEPVPADTSGQWVYHEIAGTQCRDGSPAGFYTLFSSTSTKLLIYLEQGGACFNPALCTSNPASVGDSITGRTLSETIAGLRPGVKQVPQTTGLFDLNKRPEPVQGLEHGVDPLLHRRCVRWERAQHHRSGVSRDAAVRRLPEHAEFVGHIVPTFPAPERVVLTGTSAGSFGAGLSFNQVQDAYGKVR